MPDTVIIDREVLETVLAVLEGKQALDLNTVATAHPKAASPDKAVMAYTAQRLRYAVMHPTITADIYVPVDYDGETRMDKVADGVPRDAIVARLRRLDMTDPLDGTEGETLIVWAAAVTRRPGDTFEVHDGQALVVLT